MLRENRGPVAAPHEQMTTLARLEGAASAGKEAFGLVAVHKHNISVVPGICNRNVVF